MRLLLAAIALAAPQPITQYPDDLYTFALSQGRALYTVAAHGDTLVRARAIGSSAAPVTVARVPVGAAALAASGERVGLVGGGREYTGPPEGPLTLVAPSVRQGFTPHDVLVDGQRQLLGLRKTVRYVTSYRWVLHEPGRPDRELSLPERASVWALAGDRVLARTSWGLLVKNWRTGSVERRLRFRYEPAADLRNDGVLVYLRRRSLYLARPGAPPRRRMKVPPPPQEGTYTVAWSGEQLLLFTGGQLAQLDPPGGVRRIGARTHSFGSRVLADGAHVVWTAHGCLLGAFIDAGPAAAIGRGPCMRTEVGRWSDGARTINFKCVAAPGRICRVEINGRRRRLQLGQPLRFRYQRRLNVFAVDPGGRRERIY